MNVEFVKSDELFPYLVTMTDLEDLVRLRALEEEVKNYLLEITHDQIGAGENPIGFLLASHNLIRGQLKEAKIEINELQMDITDMMSWEQNY